MNLIISMEKEFCGEEIEKLNEEFEEEFFSFIQASTDVFVNIDKSDTHYWVMIAECWLLNQNPKLRQKIFDS